MEKMNRLHINEIQQEYTKIDNEWLVLHYTITVGIVLFALAIECIIGVLIIHSDMLTTTVPRYILKFIVAPSSVNFICLIIDTIVMRSEKLSQKCKIYIVSIIFVIISFVLFTAHSAFTATYFIFSGAIMLTTIYAKNSVTFFTVSLSMVALIFSELFLKWDVDKASIFESTPRLVNFLISLFILLAFSAACMVAIRYEQRKNAASIQIEKERQLLQQRLRMDELTGLYNRKALHDAMRDTEDADPAEHYIFAIVDIDYFKSINDQWGHHAGDQCLLKFSQVLKENCEKYVPFRYGGDEFCLLFHNVKMDEAVFACKRIQSQLTSLHLEENSKLELTASFGLAEYSDERNAAQLFVQADQALYEAKTDRNRIQVFHRDRIVQH